jgi:hypothetical protein
MLSNQLENFASPRNARKLLNPFRIASCSQDSVSGVVHAALDWCDEFVIPLVISSKDLGDELSLLLQEAIILGLPNQGVLHSN